ncbi:MAG TPA: phosphoribosylglycinamide synthetase C domain-containing protein, partial [Candidatus Poseidoniales archaeon]|nr:phosphoribosylglycinamide synthetase C domain-containing protein [Candidatus Poseidoniales archaeon]
PHQQHAPPWVIKRCGLAAGKGVTVTSEAEEAETAVLEALELDGHVLLESFLKGREASIFCLMDENAYRLLPASQDHKRAHDGDKGPNTGGMGAYAPAPLVTTEVLERVEEMVVKPMHAWTVAKGGYRGCLYIGLMIDDDGLPSVVEFNARFGDPETQVVVPLLGGHLLELLAATACGTLDQIEIPQISKAAVTVVLASEGYPGPSSVGHEFLVDHAEMSDDVIVHLAGVRSGSSGMLTSGGRVCGVTAVADGLPLARSLAYANISRVNYKGAWSRTDIGWQIVV